MDSRFENIDNVLKASDIVVMLQELEQLSSERYKQLTRSDGIAKKGKAMAVLAASQHSYAAKEVLNLIDKELNSRKGEMV